jgi:hypothetical protein
LPVAKIGRFREALARRENDMSSDEERLLSGDAWRDWCRRLETTGLAILGDEFPGGARERAEGFRWLTRLLVHATQLELETGDPQHPDFLRYETPHNQWGGPNPDNIYLRAPIDPACRYRIWANVTGVRQAIFSLHEGEMHLGQFGVYGERSLPDFEVDADGHLEIQLAPEEQPRNWMPTDPKARLLTIRIFQSDWERDAAPVFHIERVGGEGVPRPPLEPASVARALDRAATWVERSVPFWNRYTAEGWKRATPNVANPARSAPGGADNILYGSCFFELADDEALLLTCDTPDADYWGFTLHTLGWLESGDFADRQTSLNRHQTHRDGDGAVRIVLAAKDPGAPNWIDTEGRRRGLLVYRFVWARNNPVPSARVTPLGQLRDHLPVDHPVVDPGERRRRLAQRREAAWNRFR